MSCHLGDAPLHDAKFKRLLAAAPRDLAGGHHAKKPEIGCIGCHGGADLGMRLRVWTVAGVDTLRYLVRRYGEPTHMRLPLRDAECRQCHTPILGKPAPRPGAPAVTDPSDESTFTASVETEGREGTSYHAIRDHDAVRIRCVRCHTAHTTDGEAGGHFISKATVTPLCRECHREM